MKRPIQKEKSAHRKGNVIKTQINAKNTKRHSPQGVPFFSCPLIQSERARKENRFPLIAESASFHAVGVQAHTVRGLRVAVPSMLVESNILLSVFEKYPYKNYTVKITEKS